jgi:hypothetical protein
MKYYTYWDNGNHSCGQVGPFCTSRDAVNAAYDLLEGWMESANLDEYDDDKWNTMIEDASVCVDQYDPETDSMLCYWEPTDSDLAAIGWIER